MQERFEYSEMLRKRLVTYFVVHHGVELSVQEAEEALTSLANLYRTLFTTPVNSAGEAPSRHTEPRGDFERAQSGLAARADKSP